MLKPGIPTQGAAGLNSGNPWTVAERNRLSVLYEDGNNTRACKRV